MDRVGKERTGQRDRDRDTSRDNKDLSANICFIRKRRVIFSNKANL